MIQRLSLTIWGLFTVLLLVLSALGYAAMQVAANRIVPPILETVTLLKARGNQGLFLQAEHSVQRLHNELLRRLDGAHQEQALRRFDQMFARSPDGLWRLRPELVDAVHAPTLYLHHGPQGLDASARLRAMTSYDLLREQGPALVPPFFSVYMDFVEDGLMVYSRGIDWGSGADAQATNAHYPTMLGSDPQRNPKRDIFWTPVYLDNQAQTWMVSVINPLDWRGRWVGTVGHDLSIQTLLEAVSSNEYGLQLIMSAAGDLIAHPNLRGRIAAADGQLRIESLHDALLTQVHQLIKAAPADTGASLTADRSHWVAWSRIEGPGWYQIYLLPQATVNGLLMRGLAGLFAVGLLCLLPGLWLLRRRIREIVGHPLQRLTHAVDTLGQGGNPGPIATQSHDELGRLASAFDTMVAELAQQRGLQTSHAQALQREVDERRQYMARLEEERARLLALLGAMELGVVFASTRNQVTYCNNAFMKMWHVAEDSTPVGRTLSEIFDASITRVADADNFTAHVQAQLANTSSTSQFECAMRDGRIMLLGSHPVRDGDGHHVGHLWVCEDVTQERQIAQQLIHLAERDVLTGLYNRRRFEEELHRFFKEAQRLEQQGALLFFDLDEFKFINDTFGHHAGDAVLIRMATEVRTLIRETDTLSRLGGDEFAIFMPHATLADAQQLAERIIQSIARTPVCVELQTLRLTTSLGIAHYPTHAGTPQDLVTHADTAMYQAKHQGKNRWSVYRPDRDASGQMVARLAWNDRIAHALEAGLLRLHFQGVYHAADGRLAHLEALVRMVDADNPDVLVSPGQFIAHAEKSGKILDIDRWVIREGIRLLSTHPQLPGLAINISGRSFDDPDLPDYISAQLQHWEVAPQRLLVELTETSAVSDLRDAARFIDALRLSGCTICLDDFGTGFASFAYLKHLKVDVLKIDGLFIRDLHRDPDNQVFVRSIIEVARGMGKHTVAEFVENAEILQLLKAFGVDMVQGYHLDKPQAQHPALTQTHSQPET